MQRGFKISQDFYPEQLGYALIVNAPWSFAAVWSMIQGWLDEKRRNSIKFVKGDPLPEILKHVDISQIPDFLGGKNTKQLW